MKPSFDRILSTWSPSSLCWIGVLSPRLADLASFREGMLFSSGFSPVSHPKEVFFS